MANAVFAAGREGFATAQVNWPTDTINVTAIDLADDTISLAADDFYDDIAAAARVATVALSGKTATGGVLDAADATMTAVVGDQFEALIIWKNTGTESTSRLLVYLDTSTTGAISLTPNGGDVLVVWSASGIATI